MTSPEESGVEEPNVKDSPTKNGEVTDGNADDIQNKIVSHFFDNWRFFHDHEELPNDPDAIHELYEQAKREVTGEDEADSTEPTPPNDKNKT